ncbi:MAG: hypothetical protein LBU50_02870 [Cellulomonas sp.]|nr:hypothetical protein [Cellulomonas sp.]
MADPKGLDLDPGELQNHGQSLATLVTTLDSVQGKADDLKGRFGHSGVEHEVIEVSSQWDDRRRGLVEALRGLSGLFSGTGESFETTDAELAAACTAEE